MAVPGNPVPSAALTLLETLLTLEIGAANRKGIEGYLEYIQQSHHQQASLTMDFPVCRLQRCHNQDQVKLLMSCHAQHPTPLRVIILHSLIQLDIEKMHGQAPRGYLEEELEEYLSILNA